jgi:hypothetical protein
MAWDFDRCRDREAVINQAARCKRYKFSVWHGSPLIPVGEVAIDFVADEPEIALKRHVRKCEHLVMAQAPPAWVVWIGKHDRFRVRPESFGDSFLGQAKVAVGISANEADLRPSRSQSSGVVHIVGLDCDEMIVRTSEGTNRKIKGALSARREENIVGRCWATG